MFNSPFAVEILITSIFVNVTMIVLMFYAFFKRGNEAAFGWIYSATISLGILVVSYLKVKFGMREDLFSFLFILLIANLGLTVFFASLFMGERHTRHEYALVYIVFNLAVSVWAFIAVNSVESGFWRFFPSNSLLSAILMISALLMLVTYDYKFKPSKARLGIVLLSAGLILDGVQDFSMTFTANSVLNTAIFILGAAGRIMISSGQLLLLYGE